MTNHLGMADASHWRDYTYGLGLKRVLDKMDLFYLHKLDAKSQLKFCFYATDGKIHC